MLSAIKLNVGTGQYNETPHVSAGEGLSNPQSHVTRLPSHLRQTTRKRVYFRSRDKEGCHTIRPAIAEKSMLQANFTAPLSIESELLPTEVLHCGNREFCAFLQLWPWPWPDDHGWWPPYASLTRRLKMNFPRQRFQQLSYYIQTYSSRNITTPLHGWWWSAMGLAG